MSSNNESPKVPTFWSINLIGKDDKVMVSIGPFPTIPAMLDWMGEHKKVMKKAKTYRVVPVAFPCFFKTDRQMSMRLIGEEKK